MLGFAKRNLKVFFRDKASVFFSLLAVIIIIGLYVLFLGDAVSSEIKSLGDKSRNLMDLWIIAGVVAVTSITTTMGAFEAMVNDKQKKIIKDFSASPLKRADLAGGYMMSSYIIAVIMSIVAFVLGQIYVLAYGGDLFTISQIIKILGIILLSSLSSSAMIFFVVSFFKSQNAFATASTIVGTLIGFLTGIYIPVGSLPSGIQMVVKCFPISHSGALARQVLMTDFMNENLKNAPEAYNELSEVLGITFKYGEHTMQPWGHILVLIGTAILFYILAIINVSRKSK